MNCVLLLVTVVIAQAAGSSEIEEFSKIFNQNIKECMKMHELTPEQMKSLTSFQVPTEKSVKCFIACMAKGMDIMKNDNTFDKRKITTVLKPLMDQLNKDNHENEAKKINEIIDICVPLQKGSGDECVAAKNGYECIIENAKKMELIPKS